MVAIKREKNADLVVIVLIAHTKTSFVNIDMNVKIEKNYSRRK